MNDHIPAVSVILPTYRRPALLRRAIASVLAQSFGDFELIVVDDASGDETADTVHDFRDPRVRFVGRTANGRAAAARNDGITLARAPLLAFQDDDDVWLPHKLERQVATMKSQPAEVGLLVCSYIRWERKRQDQATYVGGERHFQLLDFSRGGPRYIDYSLIATPGWLLRKEALERVGPFDTRFRSWDDWELGLRLWKACRFAHLDEPLFIQDHVQGRGMMGNDAAYAHDMRIILEKHSALWESRRREQSRNYYMAGRGTCMHESVEAGRPWLWKALGYNPLNLMAWGALFASLFGRDGVRAFRRMFHLFRRVRYAHHELMGFWIRPR